MENDVSYYMRRAAEEGAAATATHGRARDVHLELARRYQERVHSAEVEARRSAIHAVIPAASHAA